MFSLDNRLELRKINVSCLLTCIYLPSIVTVVSYLGVLYSVGEASSVYILVLIFVAELLKSFYLNSTPDTPGKRNKQTRIRIGEWLKSCLFLLCTMFSFFVGMILFGAPFLDSHEETLMLSALLTLLTVFPLILHTGVEATMQLLFGVKALTKDTAIEMLVNNALFTVGGAWLGAVVIPLDWNTPWQQWPIPCYLGAIGGYILSNVLAIFKISIISAASKYPTLNMLVNILNKIHVSK